MPIYEYECQACSHRFEEWQKISDAPVQVCPKCQANRVEKLISQTSFQLKGGGWYSDLYASSKPKAGNADKGTAPSPSGGTPSTSGGGGGSTGTGTTSTSGGASGSGTTTAGAAKSTTA